jgi:hypothetical protein
MSLGAPRGLVDLYCFALYNTALTEYRAQAEAERAGPRILGGVRLHTARTAGATSTA